MMAHRFERQSPRYSPRPIPPSSPLIGAIAPVLFVALLAQGLFSHGLGMWAVGVAYILYDTALLIFTAAEIRGLAKGEPAPAPGAHPRMTVIVAAHNEAAVLGITIDTLMAQAGPPEAVLLADDGSNDGSAKVMAELYGLKEPALGALSDPSPTLPVLRWLRLPHGGKARALNAAMAKVDTELVCTLDADTLLAPGALQAMRQAFAADPTLVSATGVLVPICGPKSTQRLFQWFQRYEYVRNFLSRYAWARFNCLLLISGAFAGFRTEAVREVGGFDDDCMVEDYELIHRMLRHSADEGLGWTTRVVGRAVATTDAPASALGFLRQRRRWFGGFLQTQHWYRDMVGNRHYGALGTAHLPIKSLDRWQPLYGLAAFLLLIALAVTGRFHIVLPIIAIMLAKVAIDLAFHLWSITIYRRWTGQREGLALAPALFASILEPFTFQLLRHIGAAWGWIAFLRGRETWVKQHRTAITASGDR